jgi:DNA-binding response OmpR family regulator
VAQRILICDDDEDIASAVRINLELEGYEVLEARDGYEVLDVARRLQPELVVLDLVMPGLDGIEVCRQLKADPRTSDAAVVFLTARSATRDEALGLLAGADDYMVKPFHPADLVARVHGLLGADGSEYDDATAVTVLAVGPDTRVRATAVSAALRAAGYGPVVERDYAPVEVGDLLELLTPRSTTLVVIVTASSVLLVCPLPSAPPDDLDLTMQALTAAADAARGVARHDG